MKSITQIPSTVGYQKLTMDPVVRKQSRALQKMLLNVKPLQIKANNICKQMSQHYKSIEVCLKDLRDTTEQLRKTYQIADKSVNIGKLD